MTNYFFFIPAGLAVLFMLWVLFKFTQQLAGPRWARRAQAESRYLRVIPADSPRHRRAGAH